jgi:hypothetical protein
MAFGKNAQPHQKLDSSEAHVPNSVVPLQPFLFNRCNVLIGMAYNFDGCVESVRYIVDTFVAARLESRQVVSGIYLHDDGIGRLLGSRISTEYQLICGERYRFIIFL